jgi:mRNA-degrading endonuclease toxin of MazEF toxin-antitoxin module
MVSSTAQGWKPQDSIALTEQLRALSLERFEQPRIGKLTPRALAAVELGIAYVLDLP